MIGLYLDALFGAETEGGLIEIRRLPSRRQSWHDCRDRRGTATALDRDAQHENVYIAVAPRRSRSGRREAVERVHVLWADCDDEQAIAELERFQPAPAIVVGSGNGHHAYWPLWPPASPDEAESANRRLAHALGADMAATDAARVLRPPGTFNHKLSAPAPVELAHLAAEIFTLEQVVGDLPDPPVRSRGPAQPRALDTGGDPLLAIPPAVYVEALTGREPGRDSKVRCPFHDDRTPSLHVYPTVEGGWCCHAGCGGGRIIDFGAKLYGVTPRGAGYREILDRLRRDLRTGLREAA